MQGSFLHALLQLSARRISNSIPLSQALFESTIVCTVFTAPVGLGGRHRDLKQLHGLRVKRVFTERPHTSYYERTTKVQSSHDLRADLPRQSLTIRASNLSSMTLRVSGHPDISRNRWHILVSKAWLITYSDSLSHRRIHSSRIVCLHNKKTATKEWLECQLGQQDGGHGQSVELLADSKMFHVR